MFEVWFLQAFYHLFLNIFIAFLPWIIFVWILIWNKLKWFELYLFSWLLGFWVVSFSMFNLQFFHFWIWKIEYFALLSILIFWFIFRLFFLKEKFLDFINSLSLNFKLKVLKNSFSRLSKIEKVLFWFWFSFLFLFISISFAYSLSFPTYFWDSFRNRNGPAVNIFYDWWVKLFWARDEILGGWRLWYPIYLSIYKALISDFVWYWNDIYSNIFQYFIYLFLVLFSFYISFKKTANIFYSIIPWVLISWLPLTFFHVVDWYMELACAFYSVVVIYLLINFFQKKDYEYLVLWILFSFILAYLKNDWFVVYLPWILFWFFTFLILKKGLSSFFKSLFAKKLFYKFIFLLLFFFIPFLWIKLYHWLWFNQAAFENSWVEIHSIHTEIFPVYKDIFFENDNYNISIAFLLLILSMFYFWNRKDDQKIILLSVFYIFLIINLVFLFTANYQWVLNQTTVNRIFTMIFVILFVFLPYFIKEENA